jgi:hypothetical protein
MQYHSWLWYPDLVGSCSGYSRSLPIKHCPRLPCKAQVHRQGGLYEEDPVSISTIRRNVVIGTMKGTTMDQGNDRSWRCLYRSLDGATR